jgi:hypothetical protein
MSKFNTKKIVEKVENKAGGQAYKQSDEMAFISLLLTSFVKDQFYRKADESLSDMKGYIKKIKDKEFLAKSAIFARDEFGMRSITHALAGELASEISGKEWSKNFYSKVVSRVDDMSEILSYYLQNKTDIKSPKFPNSLKKGFAKAFDKFDAYQLGKYRSENKDVKLVDIVNLVHPTPTKKNGEALSQLINGDLKSAGTWESMLTSAGQRANDEEELKDLKADAWDELLTTRKLGYFALLRNLRNIIIQSPKSVTKACEMLIDENLIVKSKVLPFRFSKAYDEISKLDSNKEVRDVLKAINEALNVSVMNVPKLDGETLVVIDVSGSMSGTPSEIASLFGAMLIKANECDVMTFATKAEYINYDPSDTVISLRNKFRFSGGGTNFQDIFKKANKKYENIIILSDCQGWIGYTTPVKEYNQYKKDFNANPHVFSWDLAGMSTLQFPENQIYCLAGFSDKVFEVMKFLKTDKKALLNRINSIQI